MCGIAAISLTPGSTINARALSHALLSQIEKRGSHASGFAFSTTEGVTGSYKSDKPGSQLPLGTMPRNASTVILHTRFATQGSPSDNRNNHPVMSPSGNIALVHNGVISNDTMLRRDLGMSADLGEVDSLVIPALLEAEGSTAFKKLRGYAAVSWIDSAAPNMLQIARLKQSPVAYAALFDGSFVMASTEEILVDALEDAGLYYGGVFSLGERRQITVEHGFIHDHFETASMSYDTSAWNRHSAATSGTATTRGYVPPARPTTTTTTKTTGSEDKPVAKSNVTPILSKTAEPKPEVKAEESSCSTEVAIFERTLAEREADWERMEDEVRAALVSNAMSFDDGDDLEGGMALALADSVVNEDGDMTSAEFDAFVASLSDEVPNATAGYYTLDTDGDITYFPTLDDLESCLKMLGAMTRRESDIFADAPDTEHWANYVQDIGAMTESGNRESFVEDMARIDEHESPAVRHLDIIRDGVGRILSIAGR